MATLKIVWLLFLLSNSFLIKTCQSAEAEKKEEDLEAAEANGKLEIIKQIKKVNDDGSYTIGYEADDGSFKIESRDVLGNIKGTYGYIDDDGEIKRVSYSTSNATEIITSTNEPPSVVQRIPSKVNRTVPTTRRPYLLITSTVPTTTASVIIQPLRRRISSTTAASVIAKEKEKQFIKEALVASKATVSPFETSTPARILAQTKPLVRASSKLEGQLARPETVLKTTDMPLYRRLPIKTTLLEEDTKPVTEPPEHSNVLRRQLPVEKFDPRAHILNLQQGAGNDAVDVYSSSATTGAPRPLFTTLRPRITTAAPLVQSTVRYPAYQKLVTTPRVLQDTIQYTQETSTEPTITPSPVPVVQIPSANEQEKYHQRQQFVQLRHPYHRGAILVPVSHQQQQQLQQDARAEEDNLQQYQEPLYVRRVPKYRPAVVPVQVQVEEPNYVREYPAYSPRPHPYVSQNDIINEVDRIKPPVSTKDFQKLLEHLLMRQSRLEKIAALARTPNYTQRPVYQDVPVYNAPVQFIPRTSPAQGRQDEEQRYNHQYYAASNNYQTKRMVQQQHQHQLQQQHEHNQDDEYLPAPIREMLLLRMLQLAINPSLPLEVMDSVEAATTPLPRKDTQVRNVEILGEDEGRRPTRTKRYKQVEFDYFD